MGASILSSIVIVVLEVAIAAAVGVSLWSVARSFLNRGMGHGARGKSLFAPSSEASLENGIPAARISRSIAIGLPVILILTFLLGSSSPILINGLSYSSAMWLKLSDMFIVTLYVMLLLAAIAVMGGYFYSTYIRRRGYEDKKK